MNKYALCGQALQKYINFIIDLQCQCIYLDDRSTVQLDQKINVPNLVDITYPVPTCRIRGYSVSYLNYKLIINRVNLYRLDSVYIVHVHPMLWSYFSKMINVCGSSQFLFPEHYYVINDFVQENCLSSYLKLNLHSLGRH